MKLIIKILIIEWAIIIACSTAQAETTIIWNPDGTTTTIIDNGTSATVWGGSTGGYQGTIINNGTGDQYWENGGGVTTIPHHERPHSIWELPPIYP